jgi:hypothetical protein
MALFGAKDAKRRCPDCRLYVTTQGRGYCAKAVPAGIDVRRLSEQGLKRQCAPCPDTLSCASWESRH